MSYRKNIILNNKKKEVIKMKKENAKKVLAYVCYYAMALVAAWIYITALESEKKK